MIRQSMFFATGVAVSVLAAGPPCSAQEMPASPPQAPVRGIPVDSSGTYTYRFDDDSMTAPGLGDVPKLRVLPRASRQTVLRPRASFIAPLIRSIETAGDPYPDPIRVRRSYR
jgi:hypothetical protein